MSIRPSLRTAATSSSRPTAPATTRFTSSAARISVSFAYCRARRALSRVSRSRIAVLDIGGNNFPADVIFGARLSTVALGLPTKLTAVPALIIIVGR
jgi:hypothetical protein